MEVLITEQVLKVSPPWKVSIWRQLLWGKQKWTLCASKWPASAKDPGDHKCQFHKPFLVFFTHATHSSTTTCSCAGLSFEKIKPAILSAGQQFDGSRIPVHQRRQAPWCKHVFYDLHVETLSLMNSYSWYLRPPHVRHISIAKRSCFCSLWCCGQTWATNWGTREYTARIVVFLALEWSHNMHIKIPTMVNHTDHIHNTNHRMTNFNVLHHGQPRGLQTYKHTRKKNK